MSQHGLERAGLPREAAGDRARETQAACGEMLAEPGGLLQAELGD